MRDLGAVLDQKGRCRTSGRGSSAIASQDHQRGVVRRRRDGRGTMRL
jgi:hypothetical protein